ncbi:MAG: acyl-CoA desaturase [Cyclobacteriaceae bacterium]
MSEPGKIFFNNEDENSKKFTATLNKRVNDYFKSNDISRYGNMEMYMKTVAMLSLFILPYLSLIFFEPDIFISMILCALMGFGMAGIGLSIMHDAIHGAYSSNQSVNKFWGYTLNFVGGNAINWKIQHNVKHHSYANIHDHDEDIAPKLILRLSPYSSIWAVHKFQHIYAWVLYGLGTFFWVTFKDFIKIINFYKEGWLQKNTSSIAKEVIILLGSKLFYYAYIIGIPLMFTSYSGLEIFLGFLLLHVCSGLALAVIFQPSHLMEEVIYPTPDDKGKMQYSRFVHQLYTSVNFANENRFVTWYGGALNFQVEHHLYPQICHVHYPAIAKLVKQTTKEFNIPYYSKKGFWEAIREHNKMLKWLGKPESNYNLAKAV